MTYAYDDYVQMPTKDLYDTAIMKMAIDAAKDMYDKGQAQMENFYKTYGDFMSPIAKDMQWYGERMNNVRAVVNDAYARGINLFKSPEGRAIVAQLSHSVDPMKFNMMRQSAENAKMFLKAKAELQAQGLYNPLLAPYDEPSLSDYSTIESGVWGKMSPTPYQNIATFGNPYFEGMKPNIHRESRGGVDFSVEEINENDLRNVADAHFNELVSTPQGRLMYKYYRDMAGGDSNPNADATAREMFNNAVVDGQRRRIYRKDDYNDNYYKAEDLKLKRSSNALAWKKFEWDKDKEQQELDIKRAAVRGDNGGEGTQETGFSLAQRWYDTGLARFLSSDGITKNWWDMADSYKQNATQIYDKAMKFGGKFVSQKPTANDLMQYYTDERTADAVRNAINTPEDKRTAHQKNLVKSLEDKYYKDHNKYYSTSEIKTAFKRQYSIGMDTKSVAGTIGDTISGNDRVVQATAANVDRLFGENDIITNTAGYRRKYENKDTKELRDVINKYGVSHTTITPLGDGYASLRKGGNFTVMPRVRVVVTDENGDVVHQQDAYYDIGLSGMQNKQGAYTGNSKKYGGTIQYGNAATLQSSPSIGYGYKGPARIGFNENNVSFDTRPEWYEGDFSIYPDYNRWTEYGGWDTRESSNLKASPTQKLGTY